MPTRVSSLSPLERSGVIQELTEVSRVGEHPDQASELLSDSTRARTPSGILEESCVNAGEADDAGS